MICVTRFGERGAEIDRISQWAMGAVWHLEHCAGAASVAAVWLKHHLAGVGHHDGRAVFELKTVARLDGIRAIRKAECKIRPSGQDAGAPAPRASPPVIGNTARIMPWVVANSTEGPRSARITHAFRSSGRPSVSDAPRLVISVDEMSGFMGDPSITDRHSDVDRRDLFGRRRFDVPG